MGHVMREDGRSETDLREVRFNRGLSGWAEGAVLIEFGKTKVLCTASIEEGSLPFSRALVLVG